jgi:bile acid-coenzyme A ligase
MPTVTFGKALQLGNLDASAVTDATESLTRAAFDRLSTAAAYGLSDLGVTEDDVVALTGGNTARFLAAAFGVWKLGATPFVVPVTKTTAEIGALLQLGRPKVIIGFPPEVSSTACKISLSEVFAEMNNRPELPDTVSKTMRIGASGGSTGAAKLIAVDSPAIADPDLPWPMGMRPDGAHVMPLNITDGTGFVMSVLGLVSRCHIILTNSFDPEETLRLIERFRADWVAVTPPVMLAMWKLGAEIRNRYDLSSLRAVSQYSGGAPVWLKQAWIDWLGAGRMLETYGATESRGSTAIDGHNWLLHPGSVGRAAPGCEIAIMDAAGTPLNAGEIGEIYFRDLTNSRNFHLIGAELSPLSGGWESVGDIGRLDADGFLYICDRRKDIIATAAGTVFPLEIEGAVERHEAVRSALAIGLPTESGYERIHLLVDAPGGGIDRASLSQFLATHLSAHKIPDTIEFHTGPLRDMAGKAKRSQYRAERLAGGRS